VLSDGKLSDSLEQAATAPITPGYKRCSSMFVTLKISTFF